MLGRKYSTQVQTRYVHNLRDLGVFICVCFIFKNWQIWGKQKYIQVAVGKSEEMRPLQTFEDNIRMDIK